MRPAAVRWPVDKRDIRIGSSEGPAFDCHLVAPRVQRPVPLVVLASAIHGVDGDIRSIAEQCAARGYMAAAPDLFWRTIPGPLERGDARSAERGKPRLERLKTGEQDLVDALRALRREPLCNGRAAVMGFCYGGPYAIIAPKRLGYDVGIACHGTQMLDFIHELDGVHRPVRLLWGDLDYAAPANVLEAYRAKAARMDNLLVDVLPGVRHGYMMRGSTKAFDRNAYDLSMERVFATARHLHSVV